MSDDPEMDEVIAEFVVESNENLDALDRQLLDLEQDPANRDALSSIFRTFHTIKGTSGFLGFDHLEQLTHAAESLLSLLRDRARTLTPASAAALFATVDAVRGMLTRIEADGSDGDDPHRDLVDLLACLHAGEDVAEPAPPAAPTPESASESASVTGPEPEPETPPAKAGRRSPDGRVSRAKKASGPPESSSPESSSRDAANAGPLAGASGDRADIGEVAGVAEVPVTASDPEVAGAAPGDAIGTSTIRVDVGLLDKLMNLVGELVLARNQILQCTGNEVEGALVASAQRLDLITTELQEGVMKTRMQPIGTVWARFPRVVRDLALACGKEVRLETEGRETELDKTLIEAVKDPLTHLVRNAVDHGVEEPGVREAAGKAREGRLCLSAFHEGGHVNIEISDDGAGIDPERLRAKALAQGLVGSDQLDRMSERELSHLIFLPGFSTAEQVTNVSGRGVGMDVVKTNIERIGGTVDVASEPGRGTTFRVKIPLTLAIIPALVVTAAGDRYAIPQVNLVELVHLSEERVATEIEMVHGIPVHRLRGTLLPLVDLANEPRVDSNRRRSDGEGGVSIVVLHALEHRFGLVVDEISDTEEIVVKPLGAQLKHVGVFAGATIMGDGRVALILDVVGLAQQVGVIAVGGERSDEATVVEQTAARSEADAAVALLVVGTNGGRRVAVPLVEVNRLEEIDRAAVEPAGSMQVVQYRGSIVPLVPLVPGSQRSAWDPSAGSGPLQVVVHAAEGGLIGLVVEEVVDIVEEQIVLHDAGVSAGIVGSAVIAGRVTEVADLAELVAVLAPELCRAPGRGGRRTLAEVSS